MRAVLEEDKFNTTYIFFNEILSWKGALDYCEGKINRTYYYWNCDMQNCIENISHSTPLFFHEQEPGARLQCQKP